jgi:hypothetical protein
MDKEIKTKRGGKALTNSLKYSRVIHPPCNLLDQYRGQSLTSQFFMYAQKVDLRGLDRHTVNRNFGGDGGDKCHESFAFGASYSQMKFLSKMAV